MIDIDELRFRYQQDGFCLRLDQLRIARGGSVAVIGESGSGKTTLLSLIAGILVPESGRVMTNGVEVSSLSDAARRDFRIQQIGLVFQEFELLEHLNVLDNILLSCRVSAAVVVTQAIRERAAALAAEVGIQDKLYRYVGRLSQGERQRVALCRALLLEPALLLCDEPTGNLDPANREHVMSLLLEYVSRHDTTLLTVTHDHEMLDRFDRTVNLNDA